MKSNAPERLAIGALSKAVGVKIETIRYYEKIGLVSPPHRTAGGNRVYDGDDVRRMRFIRRCRELGFALDDIRELLALAQRDDPACARTREISEAHLSNIRAKIASLRKLERFLSPLTQACTPGKQDECPILVALEG